jgi:hypothetical protein
MFAYNQLKEILIQENRSCPPGGIYQMEVDPGKIIRVHRPYILSGSMCI